MMEKPDVDSIDGPQPGDLDRPEDDLAQPALDRRHRHRDLRLPAPALRARRAAALPDLRPADRRAVDRLDRRADPRAARGHALHGQRAGRARPQGRVPRPLRGAAQRGLHARQGRRRAAPARGAAGARQEVQAHDRGRRRPARDEGGPAPRLSQSVETAIALAEGLVTIDLVDSGESRTYSERFACPEHGVSLPELQPRIFSFNSPHGACPRCTGLGAQQEIDPDLLVPDPGLSIAEGALVPWAVGNSSFYESVIQAIAERYEIDDRQAVAGARPSSSRTTSSTARTATRSTSPTATGWAGGAPTCSRSRGSSPRSSAATARPTARRSASGSRSTCRSGRARSARARASSPRCSRSRSASATSTSSRSSRSRPRSRSSTGSS